MNRGPTPMSARLSNKSAGLVAICVVLLTMAPLIYVLSIGPALVLVEQRVISERTWKRVYYPVVYTAFKTEITKDAMGAYFRLWIHVEDAPPPAPAGS